MPFDEQDRHNQPAIESGIPVSGIREAKWNFRVKVGLMHRYSRFALPCAALLLAFAAFSQTLPQGVQKVTSVEGITEYALPNGLHVLLFPDRSKPKVTVNMTYLVGSRHEGYGETGMAHLLEHMLFKQSKSGRDVKKELTDHGAIYNGSTW